MSYRRFAVLLFVVALPAFAAAQDASGPEAGAPADQTRPVTEGRGLWLLAEPQLVTQGLDLAHKVFGDDTTPPKTGFYPEFSNMITGSGFVSAGPGYRLNFLDGQAFFDTSAAVSWHLYKMAQARLEFSQLADDHVTLGIQSMWQDNTQVSYFGLGPGAVLGGESQYRLQTTDAVAYGALRPAEWLSLDAEVGWLKRPRVMATAGTFNPHYADARVAYAGDPGMSEAYQPNFLHSELSVTANTLDSRSHPTLGGLYRAAMTSFRDQSAGTYNFDQYEAEAVQMVPLGDRRVVLGLHAWSVYSDVRNGHAVPFYLMPVIGGHNTIRSYDDYQFHDLNSVVATAELRVAVLAHLDAAVFYDAGSVAARYNDLTFDKTAVGAGLRLHMRRATFARMDVAHGAQGWTLVLRTNDSFKLSRVTNRLAAIPFMP